MEQAKNQRWLQLLPKNNIIPRKKEERAILLQCIGIALVFWIGVRMSQTYVTTKHIEIDVDIPADKAFRKAPPANLSIQLKGRGWDILYDYLLGSRIRLHYNLSQRNSIHLDQQRLLKDIKDALYADDLSLSNLSHRDFSITLEPRMEKRVPVKLLTNLKYRSGHYLSGNVKLEPDTVHLSGPRSLISPLYEWPTQRLTLGDLHSSYEGTLNLKPAPSGIRVSVSKVKVNVPVEQVTEKTLYVKLQIKNADQEYHLFPSQVRLLCSVGLSHFNSLSSSDFTAEVDLSGATFQEENTVPVVVSRQPTIVSNVQVFPKLVEFYVVKKRVN